MRAQDRVESTWVPISYGSFTIKPMRRLERPYTKMCRQKISTLFDRVFQNNVNKRKNNEKKGVEKKVITFWG